MSDVRTTKERSPSSELTGVVVGHAGLIAVVVLLVALVLVPLAVAVVVALVAGAGITALRLRRIDHRLAAAMGAVTLEPGVRPRLENVVESVAMAVGVAPPVLHVIDTPGFNAVVWGSGTGPVRCAFTTGLLDAVDRIELESVVAHQLALVSDGCLDRVTVAAALFGPAAVGPFEPVVASVVHRTVRDRSVVAADLDGVRATRYPPGLVAALEKARDASTLVPSVPPALGVLCFAVPDDGDSAFSVHPPIADRIDLLREI